MLVACPSAAVEIDLPGTAPQTIQFCNKTVQRKLRVRGRQNLLECEEIHVHPGYGAGQPWDIRSLIRACAVRGAPAGKPADVPGPDTQDRRIGWSHASTA